MILTRGRAAHSCCDTSAGQRTHCILCCMRDNKQGFVQLQKCPQLGQNSLKAVEWDKEGIEGFYLRKDFCSAFVKIRAYGTACNITSMTNLFAEMIAREVQKGVLMFLPPREDKEKHCMERTNPGQS